MRDLSSIEQLVVEAGPYLEAPDYNGEESLKALSLASVLVVGAGGLGCEILKNLVMTGFRNIHIIDMDTIDISNLNRQFLFRESDIGFPKASIAAERVLERFAWSPASTSFTASTPTSSPLCIHPHVCRIQSMPSSFYAKFSLVICGLDNIEARRWINATLVLLVDESLTTLIPMIDGGTEGFRGQLRLIIPSVTLCFECTLDMVPPKTSFPVCTIAHTPRLPEHCVEWARMLEWPRVRAREECSFDADNPLHIDWIFEHARDRAKKYGISGVTRMLTLGVVKNIVPSIASTNAIIAASCCNEAFKLATGQWPLLNDYMMYSGDESIFTYTFAPTKKPHCPVCGQDAQKFIVNRDWTLAKLVDRVSKQFKVPDASFATSTTNLFFSSPPALRTATEPNLAKPLSDLVSHGEQVVVTHKEFPLALRLLIIFDESQPQERDPFMP